jgi:hypothetical protein
MRSTLSRTANSKPRLCRRGALGVTLALLLWPVVGAAAPSASDRTMAQSLFEEARRLMTAKDYAAACPKLLESNRLDPSGGTLLNLALCREHEGKLATAWAHFKQALSVAKRDARPDRAQAAEEHLKALEGRVPSIKLAVASPQPSEEVLVDGESVGSAAWGTSMALDPGEHRVSARVPGHPEWTLTFDLPAGQSITIEVPAFPAAANTGTEAQATLPEPAAPAESGGKKTLGFVIAGAGVVALGVGSYFGLEALGKQAKSDRLCPTHATCSDEGVRFSEQANSSAWVANIGIGVGLVGVLAGTYLVLSAPSSEAGSTVAAGPVLRVAGGPGGGQLSVTGAW